MKNLWKRFPKAYIALLAMALLVSACATEYKKNTHEALGCAVQAQDLIEEDVSATDLRVLMHQLRLSQNAAQECYVSDGDCEDIYTAHETAKDNLCTKVEELQP